MLRTEAPPRPPLSPSPFKGEHKDNRFDTNISTSTKSHHKEKHHHHHHHDRRESENALDSVAIPLFASDDGASYALQSGIINDKRLCRRQREAYLNVQHKIIERQDQVRALIISANVLSMSVMASQLVMYRWKVSEAQTVTEATAILHEEITTAQRKSYRVARKKAKPLYDLDGDAADGAKPKKRRSKDRDNGNGYSKYAAAVAAAGGGEEAEEALRKIFSKRVARSLRKKEKEEERKANQGRGGSGGRVTATAAAAALSKDPSAAARVRTPGSGRQRSSCSSSDSDSDGSSSASSSRASESGGGEDGAKDSDSLCSVEDPNRSNNANADGSGVQGAGDAEATPPDAITRLVIVDCFTHEPFSDIIEHLRYMDRQYGLELVIVLLLPQGPQRPKSTGGSVNRNDGSSTAPGVADVQGPGVIITPQYEMSLDAAYRSGYDLVLTHYIDHIVVEFLTNTFVSSTGRWRNDVRAKAAFGNYVSLKNVLLGRIDIDALKQLVWSDAVDDAELLEAIGTSSLAMQGETKQYALAGKQLSEQQRQPSQESGGAADVMTLFDEGNQSILPSSLPHLRSRESNRGGVRARGSGEQGGNQLPLSRMDGQHDVLGTVMIPSGAVQHAVRRKCRDRSGGGLGGDGDSNESSLYETVLVDEASANRSVYMEAIESEMGRLIAENESKQGALDLMHNELGRLHKTVAILRQKLGCGDDSGGGLRGSLKGDGIGGEGGGGRDFGRPDSGTLRNLSKEQQIYILKERLEAANERIQVLTEGDDGGRGGGHQGLDSSAASRSGLNSGAGRRLNSKGGTDARRTQLQKQRRQKMMLAYQEHRESELLTLHDMDADWVAAMQAMDEDGGVTSSSSHGRGNRGGNKKGQAGVDDAAARRREQDEMDSTMQLLRSEVLYLRQLQSDVPGDAEHRPHTVQTMEEAMKRLETQKQRIQSLEELRQMDENAYKRQIDQLKFAAARALSASKKGGGSASKDKEKKKTGKKAAAGKGGSSSSFSAAAGGRTHSVTPSPSGDADAATDVGGIQKLKAKHAKELAELEERLTSETECAVEHALADERRRQRFKQRDHEAAVRAQLTRLYLRIRKPLTADYRALLETDYGKAMQEVRGARQRLQFALANAPAAEEGTSDNGLEGPIGRIADPVVRQRMTLAAREHAHYSLLAGKAKSALDAFDTRMAEREAKQAELVALHEAQLKQAAHVRDHCEDLQQYLEELLQLSQIEDALSAYAEVDCSPALKHSQAWRCFSLAAEEAEKKKKTATAAAALPPPPLTSLDGSNHSSDVILAAVGGEASQTVVALQDGDGLLSGIADVFLAAFDEADKATAAGRKKSKPTKPKGRTRNVSNSKADSTDDDTDDDDDGDIRASIKKANKKKARGRGDAREEEEVTNLAQALAAAVPAREVLEKQKDVAAALRQSRASVALTELYDVLGCNFAQGFVHPDRMADVDENVSFAAAASGPTSASGLRDGSSLSPVELYLAHRQELVRMLRVVALAEPMIETVIASYVNTELTKNVEADVLLARKGTDASKPPVVTLPLLIAADTAMVASVVDLMGAAMKNALQEQPRNRLRVKDKNGNAIDDPTEEEDADMADLLDALEDRTLRHLAPTSDQITSYTESRKGLAQALQATQKHRLIAYGRQNSRNSNSESVLSALLRMADVNADDDGDAGITNNDEEDVVADVKAILSRNKKYMGNDQATLLSMFAQPHANTEYTAEDLAQMFSKRRKNKGGALTLEDIYLEQGDFALGDDVLFDDFGEGEDDENLGAMKAIQLELNLLNAARQQRMEELVLRYQLRRRARAAKKERAHDAKRDGEGGSSVASPQSPREVPDFEVKSGSAAWYGMEAAKRVKDILRRRTKPGQIVVGGGPDGGGVGVELSKRTAFPLPPPKEIEIVQTAQERVRAARIALPPLKRRGLSRWQQNRYNNNGNASQRGPGDMDGYIHPRDEASLNAFGNVASLFEFDGMDRLLYTPVELTNKVLEYRAAVSRAASRFGTGGNPLVAKSLGPSYYTPILTGGGGKNSQSPSSTTSERGGSNTRARPELTGWTYGLPADRVREMLSNPYSEDANGANAAVLFLPHHSHSSIVDQQEQNHLNRASRPPGVPRFLLQPQPQPSSFLSGASVSGACVSPSALAAQHISALLRMSMADPTVVSRNITTATPRQAEERQLRQAGGDDGSDGGSGISPYPSRLGRTMPPPSP